MSSQSRNSKSKGSSDRDRQIEESIAAAHAKIGAKILEKERSAKDEKERSERQIRINESKLRNLVKHYKDDKKSCTISGGRKTRKNKTRKNKRPSSRKSSKWFSIF
jgi:sialic acid synthase SpsE